MTNEERLKLIDEIFDMIKKKYVLITIENWEQLKSDLAKVQQEAGYYRINEITGV